MVLNTLALPRRSPTLSLETFGTTNSKVPYHAYYINSPTSIQHLLKSVRQEKLIYRSVNSEVCLKKLHFTKRPMAGDAAAYPPMQFAPDDAESRGESLSRKPI